jgi:hypothetical protein
VSTDEYIAEAQRLAISQNRTLRFMYETRWAWWLPRVGMVGFIVYFLVSGFEGSLTAMFGAFLVLSFLGSGSGGAVWRKRAINVD